MEVMGIDGRSTVDRWEIDHWSLELLELVSQLLRPSSMVARATRAAGGSNAARRRMTP